MIGGLVERQNSKRIIHSYVESLLRKDWFVAMCRCQDSLVFEVGK